MAATTLRRRRTVNYPWVAFMAVASLVLGWIGNTVLAFVRDWSGAQAWLAVPVVSTVLVVLTAIATAQIDTFKPTGESAAAPAPGAQPVDVPSPRRSGSGAFVVAVAVVALVVAVVGVALTFGVRYAVGWATGDEDGVDRLVAPVSTTDRGLSLTVEEVVQTRHFTRVTAVAGNGLSNPVTLNVYRNAVLQAGNGATLQADAFRSDWVEELPPGANQRGVIVFGGHLPDDVQFSRLSFTTVFEMGFDGPDSITVAGMRLRPPDR
jgi:hypothetical protein